MLFFFSHFSRDLGNNPTSEEVYGATISAIDYIRVTLIKIAASYNPISDE
jgi:hypothetical protein